VITASNDWFQNRSVGGFGALNFSKQVGADTVLSMVPQYSISRGKVPFENRWADEARNVSFAHDYIDRSHDPVCETFVFYDMFHAADKKHVDLIRRSRRIFEIRLPFIGHEGVPAPILKEVVIAAAEGRASDIRLRSREIYRDIKKGLPEYYFYLATQQRSIKPASKAALLTKAVEIDPSNQNMQRGSPRP